MTSSTSRNRSPTRSSRRLKLKLSFSEKVSLTKRQTVNAQAYDLYLRGQAYLYRLSKRAPNTPSSCSKRPSSSIRATRRPTPAAPAPMDRCTAGSRARSSTATRRRSSASRRSCTTTRCRRPIRRWALSYLHLGQVRRSPGLGRQGHRARSRRFHRPLDARTASSSRPAGPRRPWPISSASSRSGRRSIPPIATCARRWKAWDGSRKQRPWPSAWWR